MLVLASPSGFIKLTLMDRFPKHRYQLVDFGQARKLESLGGYLVDRPSPAAEGQRRADPEFWSQASAYFDARRKKWTFHRPWPRGLSLDCGGFLMPVHPTPFGHLGLFPEQAGNWRWLGEKNPASNPGSTHGQDSNEQDPDKSESDKSESDKPDPDKRDRWALNLFGYTGASTMALVAAGFAVAHVDAAKPSVESARHAAQINQWRDRPVRYLVDDAAQFVAREVRRARRYHTIVLDPPAYGHSPKKTRSSGQAWRLQRDLWPLLDDCVKLLDFSGTNRPRLLITGHTESIGPPEVIQYLRSAAWPDQTEVEMHSSRSFLTTPAGRRLDAGFSVRCQFGVRQ